MNEQDGQPQFTQVENFPGIKFEETPWSVIVSNYIVNPPKNASVTYVAQALCGANSIPVSEINEVHFMKELANFNELMLPRHQLDGAGLQGEDVQKVATWFETGKGVLSTIFLLILSEADLNNVLSNQITPRPMLNAITRLVVVLRSGEFNSVFVFQWKQGEQYLHSLAHKILPKLWKGFRVNSFDSVLTKYLEKNYFKQAFIHLSDKNTDLHHSFGTSKKILWGRHSDTIVLQGGKLFEVLLDARNPKGGILQNSQIRNLKSLFVQGPITFSDPSATFESLTHLDWTLGFADVSPGIVAGWFPKLKSLTLRIHGGIGIVFSLEPFRSLEEFRIVGGSEYSKIKLTEGRSFFPLKVLSLKHFEGSICDFDVGYAGSCDINRLFVKQLFLGGHNSDSANSLINRAFSFESSQKGLNPLSQEELLELNRIYNQERMKVNMEDAKCCCCYC